MLTPLGRTGVKPRKEDFVCFLFFLIFFLENFMYVLIIFTPHPKSSRLPLHLYPSKSVSFKENVEPNCHKPHFLCQVRGRGEESSTASPVHALSPTVTHDKWTSPNIRTNIQSKTSTTATTFSRGCKHTEQGFLKKASASLHSLFHDCPSNFLPFTQILSHGIRC